MRAFTLDSFERPPGLREDLPTPQVGPGQLLVRVQASSVNPVEFRQSRRRPSGQVTQ